MKECTTHHHACDCREAAHAEEVAKLKACIKELEEGIRKHRLSFLGDAGDIVPEDDELWSLLPKESGE